MSTIGVQDVSTLCLAQHYVSPRGVVAGFEVSTEDQNGWPDSARMGGQIQPESVAGLRRNTQAERNRQLTEL